MPLSCDCSDWDDEGIGWWKPDEFKVLETKKRKRCKSCRRLISIGENVIEFERFHYPQHDIEERIWGDGAEIPMASWFLCEHCGEIFLNLDDLNYCVRPDENMNLLLEEYQTEIIKDNGLFKRKGEENNDTSRD